MYISRLLIISLCLFLLQVLGQLPPKTSEVVLVAMTKTQATHYHDLVKRLRSQRSLKDTNSNGQDPSLLLNNECEDGDENADPDASDPKGECAPRKKARLDNYTTGNQLNFSYIHLYLLFAQELILWFDVF